MKLIAILLQETIKIMVILSLLNKLFNLGKCLRTTESLFHSKAASLFFFNAMGTIS